MIAEIQEILKQFNQFIIAGHTNPDGDAIGSCFGLGLALEKMGKQVHVLLEPYHHKYDIIPGRHLLYEETDLPADDTVLICLDAADLQRLNRHPKALVETMPHSINIDHHFSNTRFAKYNYIDDKASSTCELVYRVLDGLVALDKAIASALYSGIAGDTGGFRHSTTSPDTMRIAGNLMAFDIPFSGIYSEILHQRSYTEVKMLGRVLDACQRSKCGSILYACVTRDMMTGFKDADTPDATIQDLEGMIDHLINTRGAKVAFLIYDCGHDSEFKVSLRSRELNVGAIAQALGGGGHHLAAGATAKGDIWEIRDKILGLIEFGV
ncbi:MAG: DHH family phosphoesterase [Defluviitaleaceae bacterium]|nr:DHH family phosphoesterase [Defluviitaleaceae bacterium]